MLLKLRASCYVMDKGRIVAELTPPRSTITTSSAVTLPSSQTGRSVMSWFEQSIMAQKGVAQGKSGAKHAITEATQGEYHYTYGLSPSPS